MQLGQPFRQLAVVLFGQDLRRCHQRALATRLNGGEEGGKGHHRFATAHIPLNQAGHGLGPGQVDTDFSENPLLGSGEREGKQLEESLHQVVATSREHQGRSRPLAELASALQQAELQQEKFIEDQAMAAGLQLLLIAGLVDLQQGLGPGNEVFALAKLLG